MINYNEALDYEDVLIVPRITTIASRSQVDTETCQPFLFASNMDGVGTLNMALALAPYNVATVLHKYHTVQDITESGLDPALTWMSIGMAEEDLFRAEMVYESGIDFGLCIDVANGYLKDFIYFVERARTSMPDVRIMAGNVCTPEGVHDLELAGADFIKVGIGPGAVCTTRLKAGVGMPQLTAVKECAAAAKSSKIIADGGVQFPGDIAKAMIVGASGVMLGSILAGHYEGLSTDDLVKINDAKSPCDHRVEFYGMSSKRAQEVHGNVRDYRSSEGRVVSIPYRGHVADTIEDILGGVRSACTYVNANNPHHLAFQGSLRVVRRQVNRSLAHLEG